MIRRRANVVYVVGLNKLLKFVCDECQPIIRNDLVWQTEVGKNFTKLVHRTC